MQSKKISPLWEIFFVGLLKCVIEIAKFFIEAAEFADGLFEDRWERFVFGLFENLLFESFELHNLVGGLT